MSPTKTKLPSKTRAKGKGKEAVSKVDSDLYDSDEIVLATPRDRSTSVRQMILQKNPKYFLKLRVDKAKMAAAKDTAAEEADSDEIEPQGTAKPKKKPATNNPAAPKAPVKTNKTPTIQEGSIVKPIKAKQPQKPRRRHRPVDYHYESVPEQSDEEKGKSNTIAKLGETIDRHARWCPFVLLNKKLHSVHRRTKRLEDMVAYDDDDEDEQSDEGQERSGVEVEDDKDGEDQDGEDQDGEDEDEDDGEDQDEDDEEDENTQPPETVQPRRSARKTAARKSAAGQATPTPGPAPKATSDRKVQFKTSDPSKAQAETPDDMEFTNDLEVNGSEDEKSRTAEAVDATAAEPGSDGELSSLSGEAIEQAQTAYEQHMDYQHQHLDNQATGPSSDKGAGDKERKRPAPKAGPGQRTAKKQKVVGGEAALMK